MGKGRRFAGLRAEQAGSYTKGQKEALARQYTGMMKREGEREAGEGGNGAGSSTSYPRPGIWRETRESAVWKGEWAGEIGRLDGAVSLWVAGLLPGSATNTHSSTQAAKIAWLWAKALGHALASLERDESRQPSRSASNNAGLWPRQCPRLPPPQPSNGTAQRLSTTTDCLCQGGPARGSRENAVGGQH